MKPPFERNITIDDVESYIDERISFLKSNGLASSELEELQDYEIEDIFGRLKKLNILAE
jgi:hypothetical protein